MDKVEQLKQWFEEILPGEGNVDRYVQEEELLDGGGVKFRIFTGKHLYAIVAKDREEDDGYLGCVLDTRMPRAGERHTRGRDKADGSFTRETWEAIKNDIVRSEVVALDVWAPPQDKRLQAHG